MSSARFYWSDPQKTAIDKLKILVSALPKYFERLVQSQISVLIQVDCNMEPCIISFVESLSEVEKWYSKTKKEFGLVSAVETFYFYFVGLEFDLQPE